MADSMSRPIPVSSVKSEGAQTDDDNALTPDDTTTPSFSSSPLQQAVIDPKINDEEPKSPRTSRNPSFSGSSSYHEDWDSYPPLDRLTVLDLLDNFALPQQLEKLQKGISAQTEKVRKSRAALKTRGQEARERMVEEWRRRVPSADEQLERYRKRMKQSVEKLGRRWNDTKIITMREKVSFICGVMNIFISGYLIGAYPEYFYIWYTVQLLYFMPIRFYTYRRRGYHYFLADLCYFVNLLLFLSLWIFPSSKRLFIASYSLAYGNNAVAIIMWRNSLVFHDFDKVTSLFIHIMPCATLHCIAHLLPTEQLHEQFPAIWAIKTSPPGSPTAYGNLISMLTWSTFPYAVWQLSYYFFITVRRREKIAAGRPTSFTWLRRSYSKTWIGKIVLSLPASLQEPAFMLIQYLYAVLTMLPCPLWFYSRWASAAFLMIVFTWSVYNGSTFYIDVFGKRFQKELEAMKAEVAKWQNSPDVLGSPLMAPVPGPEGKIHATGTSEASEKAVQIEDPASGRRLSVDEIPLLHEEKPVNDANSFKESNVVASGIDSVVIDTTRARNSGEVLS
ncbi:uncharacterized protein GGS25DRAFT_490502 [Hypoxylon fragiforme]|uniref:uncharacterized protein n=1 Tax=Hypoxylon fragiforme TaxID=63214 RepID=UPI0020C5E9F6|nr:uncharacterized protein GGS25DRAFT_490502 [Hypoxylon fragiforme]KAI2608489.1 hypothetical protein GGS25DRAFT_490502 [Hypoxylon fragiforme]